MSASHPFKRLANAATLPWADVPAVSAEELARATISELDCGARLSAWFAMPDGDGVCLVAVLAFDSEKALAVARSTSFTGSYPSVTKRHHQAHMFEREAWEQHGIIPEGHPWLKPVRRTNGDAPANGTFFRVEGQEVHEVAVGPVHAGVIEPGHFRFQCAGEEVMHLEIALGYQHRGIEEAIIGGPHRATLIQMETIAGDTSIAHATAYTSILEALAGTEAPPRAQWLRALALELERLANHTGDLGALANDVAFLPTSAACGKIRGDFLNLTALLCGNRFGRGFVRPGGCRHDLDAERAGRFLERLDAALADVAQAAGWMWDSASVRARFENLGVVSMAQADEIGLVGPAARACGLLRDVRVDHPAGWHRSAPGSTVVWAGGDVFSRARVRSLEIERSGEFLREQLATKVEDGLRVELKSSAPDTLAVAMVEGWRGEVCHVAVTDAEGRFRRYKIIDPSFHNWTGLALSLRGTAISDFPICNKSFNLSYCGFDL